MSVPLSIPSQEEVSAWLRRAGFLIGDAGTQMPPGASWALAVFGGPGSKVKVTVIGFEPSESIAVTIGVAFSEAHRRLIMGLDESERLSFMARMVNTLLLLCPACRIAVQPSLAQPLTIIIQRVLHGRSITASELIDAVTRLINTFIAVNMMLMEKFPQTGRQQQEGPAVFI